MKLAVNYSREAVELLQAGQIDFDLFKCCPDAEWLHLIEEARTVMPVYLHYNLRTGVNQIQSAPWDLYLRLQAETQTPHISLHLLSPTPLADGRPGIPHVAAVLTELRPLISVFGRERIIIENLPYPMEGPYAEHPIIDPEAIRQIIDATGCGLLLDLPHAVLAARHLHMDEREYISALPLYALREMHLTGIERRDGRDQDHFGLTATDWELAGWALENISAGRWPVPGIVAFEYGGCGPAFAGRSRSDVLLEQVPRLRAMLQNNTPA